MRFTGKRAVVTGGASGIGEAVAKRIVAEGGRVVVWDVNCGIKVDISDYASVERAGAETIEQLGGIDILVNSAGITGPTVPLIEFPIDYDVIIETRRRDIEQPRVAAMYPNRG